MYKGKYLKYKKKYFELKSQMNGGELYYLQSTKFNDSVYKLLKHSDDGKKFELIDSPSNAFDCHQKMAIDNFVKYVLPALKINKEKIPQQEIDNINVMGTGQFGITLQTDKLIIKIIRTNSDSSKINVAKEVGIMYDLCIKNNPPNNITNFYCYFTSDIFIGNKLMVIDKNLVKNISINNFYTNLDYDANNKNAINDKLPQTIGTELLSKDLIFILMEKGDTNATKYFKNISGTTIVKDSIIYTKNIVTGLNYIHKLGYLHNDVKLDNVVVKDNIFKLIDFGVTMKLKPSTNSAISFGIGSPLYYVGSPFFSQRSSLYDYHCLYITLLSILRIVLDTEISSNGYMFSQVMSKEINGSVNQFNPIGKSEKIVKYFNAYLETYIAHGNEKLYVLNLLLFLMYSGQLWKDVMSKNTETTNIPQVLNSTVIFVKVKTIQEYEDKLMELIK
jgi:serine/threonine protein kinase